MPIKSAVNSDKKIIGVTLESGPVPPWFRIFKAVVLNGLLCDLGVAECRVLMALSAHQTKEKPWEVWPSIDTLQRLTGLTRRSIFRAVDALEKKGIVRRKSGSGRTSNRYELVKIAIKGTGRSQSLPTGENDENPGEYVAIGGDSEEVTPVSPVTERSPVSRKSPVTAKSDVPCQGASKRGDANVIRHIGITENNNIDGVAAALSECGIQEPKLSYLIQNFDPETITKHVIDFRMRAKIGQPKSAGWLIGSIQMPYDLHPKTVAAIEQEKRKHAGAQRLRRVAAEEQEAQDEIARLESMVDDEFDQLDDDELAVWKKKVLEKRGALARGLENADPRTNEKLQRHIKGMMVHLYSNTPADK